MKFFLSLFLSVCISLAPLYSTAGTPDLEPIYIAPDFNMGTFPMDEIYKKDQSWIKEQLQTALNNPNFKEDFTKALKEVDMEEAKVRLSDSSFREDRLAKVTEFAKIANLNIEPEEIEEARTLLNDSVFIDEQFAKIENNIEEKLKDFQNTLNNESFAERQSSEQLMAQLNHNIDQMIESEHVLGSMAMSGLKPSTAVLFLVVSVITTVVFTSIAVAAIEAFSLAFAGTAVVAAFAYLIIPIILVALFFGVGYLGLLIGNMIDPYKIDGPGISTYEFIGQGAGGGFALGAVLGGLIVAGPFAATAASMSTPFALLAATAIVASGGLIGAFLFGLMFFFIADLMSKSYGF